MWTKKQGQNENHKTTPREIESKALLINKTLKYRKSIMRNKPCSNQI